MRTSSCQNARDLSRQACGQPLTVTEAAPPPEAAPQSSAEENAPPLAYQRTGTGWEAFRCGCGRVMQLSPGFLGDHVNCTKCGRRIQIIQPGVALTS